jgi:hypothetical protein
MSVESASYISQLVSANPASSDPVSDGATHLRLLKSVLQTQFPNLGTLAVTPNAHQLNQFVPIGTIMIWYSTVSSIPSGWAFCNGQTVSRSDGGGNITCPDLRQRFPMCCYGDSVGSYPTGYVGGSYSHSHGGATGAYTLVYNDMPSHIHGLTDPTHSHSVSDPGHYHNFESWSFSSTTAGPGGTNPCIVVASNPTWNTQSAYTGIGLYAAGTGLSVNYAGGSGGAHTHAIAADGFLPAFTALPFIMRV